MKLLLLTSQVSSYHNARYISAAACFEEVHVISTMNAADFPEFLADPVDQYRIYRLYNGRDGYRKAVASGDLSNCLNQLIGQIQPDFIAVAGWTSPESLVALEYGRLWGIPTVVMSESQADDAPRSKVREALKRRIVSQFDAALVGGPTHAGYVEQLGIAPDRIHYGYNVVDNNHFEEGAECARADAMGMRKRHELPDRYILASARFIQKKNLPGLISAYALAQRRVKDAPALVLLGDGPQRATIEAAISAEDLGHKVSLRGFKKYEELPAFYGLAEGFAHVSKAEQWGLVINEAMSAGVPVLASRWCGAARTVLTDGVSGILTDTDVPAIADALTRLFEMTPEEKGTMSSAAAVAIAQWAPHRFGSGMTAAVQSALDRRRRGPLRIWERFVIQRLQRKIVERVA